MIRFRVLALPAAVLLLSACGRRGDPPALVSDGTGTLESLALKQPLDVTLTEESFAAWKAAQEKLDALERDRPTVFAASSLGTAGSQNEDPVDAGVARLEANPYARSMIEATGISVRDYVLTTLALAQAAQAAMPGNRNLYPHVSDENIRFVLARGSDLPQLEDADILPLRTDEGDYADDDGGDSDERWETDDDSDDRFEGNRDRGKKHGKHGRGKGKNKRD